MSLYRLVYDRACHLPVEIQHHALWAIKQINFSLDDAIDLRKLQISELEELKERMKALHDEKIQSKHLVPDQKVLLHNSRLHLFPGKPKSRWSRLCIVKEGHSHRAVDVVNPKNGARFTVNGQRLKPFMTSYDPHEEIRLVQDPGGVF